MRVLPLAGLLVAPLGCVGLYPAPNHPEPARLADERLAALAGSAMHLDARLAESRRLMRAIALGIGIAPPVEPPPIVAWVVPAGRTERSSPRPSRAPARRSGSPLAPLELSGAEAAGREITLVNVNTRETLATRIVGADGAVLPDALEQMRRLLRSRQTGASVAVPAELAILVARIAAHFGGRVEILSGFRPPYHAADGSYHGRGRAVDLRVPGQSARAVYLFARSIGARGAGHYPAGGFVHVDTREEPYYWVDRSRPGEPNREQREL